MAAFVPQGVIAAPVLPISDAGETIDYETLRRLAARTADVHGVTALTMNAIASEGPLLSHAEMVRVIEEVVDEVGDSTPVISGIREESPRAGLERIEQLAAAGASAVLVQAPADFSRGGARDRAIALPYFEHLVRAGVPLIIFQHQVHSGSSYPPEVLLDVLALEEVVAVKETTWDVAAYERDVRAIRDADIDVAILCANDTLLLPCLSLQPVDGLLLGLAGIVPELVTALWAALEKGDLVAARAEQDRLWPLVSVLYANPPSRYYVRAKAALHLLGLLPSSAMLAPYPAPAEDETEQVRKALTDAELL